MRLHPRQLAVPLLLLATACAEGTAPDPVANVEVTAAGLTMTAIGATIQATAVAIRESGDPAPSLVLEWSSLNPGVATVSSTGLVTAVANGTTTISATFNEISGSVAVTVAQSVATVVITPGTLATFVSATATSALSAVARDAMNAVVTGTMAWSSTVAGTATVNPTTGLVTSVNNGTTKIIAAQGGKADTVDVTVARVAASIDLTCVSVANLTKWNQTRQCNAQVRDALVQPMAGTATWSSNNTARATVNSSGLVTALNNGAVTITANYPGMADTQVLTVDLNLAYGEVVPGNIAAAGVGQSWDVTGGGSEVNFLAWIHRTPIATGPLNPGFTYYLGLTSRPSVTEGFLSAEGTDFIAASNQSNTPTKELLTFGAASSTGTFSLGVSACNNSIGALPPDYYNWDAITASDCAFPLYRDGANLIFGRARVHPVSLTSGANVTYEVVRGCSPAAVANLGCNVAAIADPFIYLVGPGGSQIWFNDDGAGSLGSRLVINPVPTTGIYALVVADLQAGTGSYTMCGFQGCAAYGPGGSGSVLAGLSAPAYKLGTRLTSGPVDDSKILTVEEVYRALKAMGQLPADFDPAKVARPKKK